MTTQHPLLVVGLDVGTHDDAATWLPATIRQRILTADVVAGGKRHLLAFPHVAGKTLIITHTITALVEQLQQAQTAGKRVVVLATGDPLCYGIGATLRRTFPAELLEIIPAPTAFQWAFAALAEPWHDAALLSVHARPLAEVVRATTTARVAAILTDEHHTPSHVAHALCDYGVSPNTPCAVCENIGYPEQRIVRTTLADATRASFAPLNVFVVWATNTAHAPAIPDERFATEARLITQHDIRLLSLAQLALHTARVMWDIGAGSGAVSIEAARNHPHLAVYAIERRDIMCEHIRENLRRHPAPNVQLVVGTAPDVCTPLPTPDAIFIGGSGGHLEGIITMATQRLACGGHIVINLVTLEHVQRARVCLPTARVTHVQINHGVPINTMLRFEARNPVYMLIWRKPCD